MAKRRANGEGTVASEREDGRWMRTLRVNGKRKSIYGHTERECNANFKVFIRELACGRSGSTKKATVEQYMVDWLENTKRIELKPKSYDRLETTVLLHVIPEFCGVQMFSLKHKDIQKFINQLHSDGLDYSSVKKAHLAMNACYNHAIIEGDTETNPCFKIKLPQKPTVELDEDSVLSTDEIADYLEVAYMKWGNGKYVYRLGAALILILFTGMRIAEAQGLTWNDIDFKNRKIKVRKTLDYIKNRDENATTKYILVEGTPKSGAGRRTIPMNQTAYQALKRLHEINGKFKYVLSNEKGNPVTPRNITRIHDCIQKRCQQKHIGVHGLRHTFASQLFARKVDVKVISKLLGHSDVSITYNIYIHFLSDEMLEHASVALDDIPNEILLEEGLRIAG